MMHPVADSISRFFLEHAYAEGGGHNVVNVILVDFRGFDTLGEISVLAIVARVGVRAVAAFPAGGREHRRTAAQRQRSALDAAQPDRGVDHSLSDYLTIPGLIIQLLSPVILLFGVHLFLRGHDLPGGGFAAGITASVALILLYMARGARWVEAHLRVLPVRWIGVGLLLAVGTGLGSLVFGHPFLTSHFQHVELPLLGPAAAGLGGAVRPWRVLPGGRRHHLDADRAGAPVAAPHPRRGGGRSGACSGGRALMELVLAIAIGILIACGVWLLLRPRTFQVIIGLTLISYAVNLFIFSIGGLRTGADPVLHEVAGDIAQYADPLPQALVLTAIVIGFATTALFLVVLLTSRGTDRQRSRRRRGRHAMSPHLIIAPILLPLLVAALQLVAGERRRRTVVALSLVSCLALVALATALLLAAAQQDALTAVYRIGDWPARFGIVLVVDRLSALMLLLTAVVALATLPAALGRWQHRGSYFQPLFQFLLMGLNGAFLTGDLFNLFVFFEVLLAASYGLALHGSGARRVSAGLHYIAVNLAASMLFLLGVSLIFGVTGTLNMAALAELIPSVPAAYPSAAACRRGDPRRGVPDQDRDVAARLLAAAHLRRRRAGGGGDVRVDDQGRHLRAAAADPAVVRRAVRARPPAISAATGCCGAGWPRSSPAPSACSARAIWASWRATTW